jgi:hypothetical protein
LRPPNPDWFSCSPTLSICISSGLHISSKKVAEITTESAFPELARAGEKHGKAGAINYISLHVGSTGDVLKGGTVRRLHMYFGGLDRLATLADIA